MDEPCKICHGSHVYPVSFDVRGTKFDVCKCMSATGCPKCADGPRPGYLPPPPGSRVRGLVACECLAETDAKAEAAESIRRFASLLTAAQIPRREADATLLPHPDMDRGQVAAMARVGQWLQEALDAHRARRPVPSLILYGPAGRGKTWASVGALIAFMAETGSPGLFVEASSLWLTENARFGKREIDSEVDRAIEFPILCFQELGKRGGVDPTATDQRYDAIVTARNSACRPTIWTTNLNMAATPTDDAERARARAQGIAAATDYLSERIRSRLAQDTDRGKWVVEFKGKDLRA